MLVALEVSAESMSLYLPLVLPEAIYQSLKRRRQRLEKRLAEMRANRLQHMLEPAAPVYTKEYLDDLDDAPAEEVEAIEEQIIDSATAALTIAELKAEIETLKGLETTAYQVRLNTKKL